VKQTYLFHFNLLHRVRQFRECRNKKQTSGPLIGGGRENQSGFGRQRRKFVLLSASYSTRVYHHHLNQRSRSPYRWFEYTVKAILQ